MERAILSLKFTPASNLRSVRRSVGGLLKYIQFRDHHPESEAQVKGLVRYVAHRDQSVQRGLTFGPRGPVDDLERKELEGYVLRSVRNLPQVPAGKPARTVPAVYRMVISPEKAAGLDLQRLTRAVLDELAKEAGSLPPWIAAVHRNTAHPHVHVVLAARRETEPGRFRGLVVTRAGLQRMKDALGEELARQRGAERGSVEVEMEIGGRRRAVRFRERRPASAGDGAGTAPVAARLLSRLAQSYRREAEREARARNWASRERKPDLEMWVER